MVAHIEDDVDLFRVWVPDREVYFWPTGASTEEWRDGFVSEEASA